MCFTEPYRPAVGKRKFQVRTTSIGLRTRLVLLVFLAVVPAILLVTDMVVRQRQEGYETARGTATHMLHMVSHEHSDIVTSTRRLLQGLSKLPVVRSVSSGPDCAEVLGDLLRANSQYTNFGVASVNGRVVCSALPLRAKVDIADRKYFRETVGRKAFSIGGYQVGRITKVPGMNFGYPLLDASGHLRGVVFAAMNLNWLSRILKNATVGLASHPTINVIDQNGKILVHFPNGKKWVGRSLRRSLLEPLVGNEGTPAVAEARGIDGTRRLYAFMAVHQGATDKSYIGVGIPLAAAFAKTDQRFLQDILLLLAAAGLTIVAALWGGEVFLLRRIRALGAAARSLAAGDLSVRSGLPHTGEEIGELAGNFDDMASALERHQRALRLLSVGNHILVRAPDEPALVSEFCKAIVEVGGYKCAWVGWVDEHEPNTIRPVAQCGFAGGLEDLARVVHVDDAEPDKESPPPAIAIRDKVPTIRSRLPERGRPWIEDARKMGYRSVCALPLFIEGEVSAVLVICSGVADAFGTEELRILEESAEDLAYGIQVMRGRVAHDRATETIRHWAYFDKLTGLPNHVQIQDAIEDRISSSAEEGFAFLILDVERFREVNDAFGFHFGDQLLRDIADRLRKAVADGDMVSRLRGDEFAILAPVANEEEAVSKAAQILDVFDIPYLCDTVEVDLGGAVGIALYPQHGSDVATLIRHTDIAMRQARSGGHGYAFYAPEDDGDRQRRLVLARELRQGIQKDELTLYFQPKVELSTGVVCGVEALVRWNHPQRGLVPPDEFVPLSEHTGLIAPLTYQVLEKAAAEIAAMHLGGLNIPVAVNLSARNLHDPELLRRIDVIVAKRKIAPGWLEVEVTESAVMADAEGALTVLEGLREYGIPVYIDDFGTGYSSLGYLKRLPVDAMKIDKSFVIDMLEKADAEALVRTIIHLAHEIGLKVVAEGIESRAVWDRLIELGCDMGQGYHISRPLPAGEFREWLATTMH
jgi:diguanylate cyclase (GGDEF)-like protein